MYRQASNWPIGRFEPEEAIYLCKLRKRVWGEGRTEGDEDLPLVPISVYNKTKMVVTIFRMRTKCMFTAFAESTVSYSSMRLDECNMLTTRR